MVINQTPGIIIMTYEQLLALVQINDQQTKNQLVPSFVQDTSNDW